MSLGAIDRLLRARHLLKHPFYTAWTRGEVPIGTLREYAGQYYHFERNFPRFVAGAYARLPDPDGRRTLLENLVDEEGRDPTHPELWLRFAEGIGAPRRRVLRAPIGPATRRLLATYEALAVEGSAAEGLGALYAYESIFPEIAAEKARGLRARYGLRDPRALAFFRVHTRADVAHSAAERALLGRLVAGRPGERARAFRAAERTTDAWWGFLDAFPAA
ncbi:MAG: CADD family putative folate metabolism protein [Thermoplasmata archaeon]